MNEHAPWVDAVLRQLDEDELHCDATVLSRLNRARQQALDAALRPHRAWRLPMALAGATAALLLSLALTLRMPQAPAPLPVAESGAEDFELLAAGAELELIENLEFYAWLEQQSLDG
ncbi:MAG: hypothetical protein IT479_00920 [Xanthomonadales bacterium]|nr:hypothetical protein [Xanthomonadales bacterium]MCC6591811.1 hypothetical protein [Xanthomonadales bacterium]MCE7931027.1 hypothetical protein [Xanthomonadales bacterium PRO6]